MNGVSKYFGRRDKKSKASVAHEKDIYRVIASSEEKKKVSKEEEKAVNEVATRLLNLEVTNIKDTHIRYALQTPFAQGDPDKAFELLRLFNETLNGTIVKPNHHVSMLGAENRNMVTCYIDSLLFAMFARQDSFESMLSVEFPDATTNTLATLLRFWVNMLRTGKLITTDIVKHIQDALADCGWEEARLIRQQDVSEAFAFITDKLALPLLALKMDVYHTGKADLDDHKIVRERLLDVAIPENPPNDGTDIKLEDCLESFFNNKIEVKRLLQRRNTLTSRPVPQSEKNTSLVVEKIESVTRQSTIESIFRHRKVDSNAREPPKEAKDDISVVYGPNTKEKDSVTSRKEVLIPAWQFYHLVPWFQAKHTHNGQPTTDAQVAAHFSKRRPVLGICLKRYKCDANGLSTRVDTYIDIPLEIKLPHFISDGTVDDGFGSSFSAFKLSLQSVICHRGSSLNAGHYISIVRPSANEMKPKDSTPEAINEAKFQWLLFDDLAADRITTVDVRKALKSECPYLVFYQVQPVDDDEDDDPPTVSSSNRTSTDQGNPPSYAEATHSAAGLASNVSLGGATANDLSVSQTLVSDSSVVGSPRLHPVRPPSSGASFLSPEAAISTTNNSASNTPLQHALSCPVETDKQDQSQHIRYSLDLPPPATSPPPGRQSNDGTEKRRTSLAFTDSSFVPSATTTPADEGSKDGYMGEHDVIKNPEPNGTLNLPKRRGRTKNQDGDDKDKYRLAKKRSSWLSVGTIRQQTRPKSLPPGENRILTANAVGDLFLKGIRGPKSKEKLPESLEDGATNPVASTTPVVVDAAEEGNTTKVETSKIPQRSGSLSAMTSLRYGLNNKDKDKDKDKNGIVKRRRSLHVKGKSRNHSPQGNGDESTDRQCTVM